MALRRELLLVSLLSVATLHAQTTFAPLGAKWTYKQGSWAGPDTNLMVLEAIGDTLIQGRTFSKLQVNEGWFGCHQFVRYFSQSNDSLLYFDPDSEQSHLLFRWDALIGEAWSTPVAQAGYLDTLDWSVADTGHIVIDGLWLRTVQVNAVPRQWLLFSYGGMIVERLGGSTPFTWILGFCDGETFLGFRCYEDADISWQNPQYAQCELAVGMQEPTTGPLLSMRPTMATLGSPIQVNARCGKFDVLDAAGRVVSQHQVRGRTEFRTTGTGVFIIHFTSCDGEVTLQRVLVN